MCFRHPHDQTKCVKIIKSHVTPEECLRKARMARKFSRFYPLYYFDINWCEYLEHQRLARMGNPKIWNHVPRHFGFIHTDLGKGIVVELIQNGDGSPAPTLADKIRKDGLPQQALAEFLAFLREFDLPNWRDNYMSNLVFASPAESHEKQSARLVIIDGLFCTPSRWLKSYIPAMRRKLAQHRRETFERNLADFIKLREFN